MTRSDRVRLVSRFALLVTLVSLAGTACKKEPAPQPSQTAPALVPGEVAAKPAPAATAPDPWQKTAPAKDPIERPFLWSATKAGTTTYLLGTMHIGIDAEARLPQIVWDKLDSAPTFAMETDLSDPALAKLGTRTSGTLRDDLGPAYWAKLEAALTPEVATAISGMKPMIAATLLSLQNLPKTPPMDGVLLGRAINQKKQIVYLESAALEAAILEKHMDVRTLKMMLDTIEKSAAQTKSMLDAYLAGDESGIVALTDSQRTDALAHGYTAKEYDQSLDDLLYRRNASWIAPIEKLHAAGGGFVAVGAMHLVGPRNVREMLEAKGFTIARVVP